MNNNPTGRNAKTPVGLRNLTRKSMELATQKILRVNATSSTHALPIKTEKVYKRSPSVEGYTPRVKDIAEAMPPSNDLWQRGTYRVGDGETRQVDRPGSQDAMKLLSKGYST